MRRPSVGALKPATDDLRVLSNDRERAQLWGPPQVASGVVLAAAAFFIFWWMIVSPEGTWTGKQAVKGSGVTVWLYLSNGTLLFLAGMLGPGRLERPASVLGFRSIRWVALGIALAAFAAIGLLWIGYDYIASALSVLPAPREDLPIAWAADRHHITFIAGVVALRPIAEEVFFRGFALQGLQHRLRFGAGAAITSALYALVYIGGGPGLVLFGFGAGLILATAYRYGGLWPSIAANAAFNIALISSRVG